MTDLDDMRAQRDALDMGAWVSALKFAAQRDAARSLAARLEQECAMRDEALAELRALHGPKRIYDDCGHLHTTEEFDALNLVDVDPIGYVCEDGLLYVICGSCCTDENGDQLAECADNHAHTDGEPVCDTARVLDALAARLSAQLFPTDEEGERRPSTDELLGIAPDWCGGLSVDEYVDRQRGRTTDEEGASDE